MIFKSPAVIVAVISLADTRLLVISGTTWAIIHWIIAMSQYLDFVIYSGEIFRNVSGKDPKCSKNVLLLNGIFLLSLLT